MPDLECMTVIKDNEKVNWINSSPKYINIKERSKKNLIRYVAVSEDAVTFYDFKLLD